MIKRNLQTFFTLLGVVASIAILAFMLSLWNFDKPPQENGIISDSAARNLVAQNLRKQLVSLEGPQMLDSSKNVYYILVGKKDLEKGEIISNLKRPKAPSNFEGGDYRDKTYFYNILIYALDSNEVIPIFSERVAISEYTVEKLGKERLIFAGACKEDANKDGFLDARDLQKLYIYSWSHKKLHKVSVANATYLRHYIMNNENEVLIEFGLDKNQDGRFDNNEEPQILYKYAMQQQQLTPLLSPAITEQLQQTLEGQPLK